MSGNANTRRHFLKTASAAVASGSLASVASADKEDKPDILNHNPRMTYRRFVMEPVAELVPDWVHPVTGWTMRRHLEHLNQAANYVAVTGPIGAGKTEVVHGVSRQRGAVSAPTLVDDFVGHRRVGPRTEGGRCAGSQPDPKQFAIVGWGVQIDAIAVSDAHECHGFPPRGPAGQQRCVRARPKPSTRGAPDTK